MKVLLVKTSSMGDVIHTFPALTDALAARPELEIDWCVEEPFTDLVRLHPGVGRIHRVAVRRWRSTLLSPTTRREILDFWRTMRGERYDLVIDAQGLVKSAVLSRLAGPRVAGLDRGSARESAATAFYRHKHPVERNRHAIDRTRLLLGRVLDYEPDLEILDYGLARATGRARPERDVFLLHGTSWASKHWHTDGWIDLGRALVDAGLRPVVTYGNPAERRVTEALASAVPQTRVVQKTSLGEIADVLKGCTAAVGTDSGLTHLACALDLPTVQIALSTAPGLTGPRGRSVDVVATSIDCAPCRKRECPLVALGEVQPCASTVTADDLMRRLQAML